jgi:hypothetical protein
MAAIPTVAAAWRTADGNGPVEHGRNCQQATGQQFPGPCRQQEERLRRGMLDLPQAYGERHQGNTQQAPAPGFHIVPQQGQQQWQKNVELFFHRQRPGMQQRLELRIGIEIAVLPREQYIGDEHGLVARRTAQFLVVTRHQEEPANDQAGHHQGRQDSPRTAHPELHETEVTRRTLAADDRGDQKARNHEEHVDANESAGETWNTKVEQHHGNDSHGAQAVDVTSIG